MKCSTCQTELVKTGKFWVCPDHGIVTADIQPVSNYDAQASHHVFISYGRQDATDFAKRLATDLYERGGHKVFIDLEGINKGGMWEVKIEQGIRSASIFAAVMTERSNDEESVCRDEVIFALNEGKIVIPLKLDPNPKFKPSLLLARRNWIDFSIDYTNGLETLLSYLHGDTTGIKQPSLPTITDIVPLDFSTEIARFTTDFTGREWVNPEIDKWLSTDMRRVMVIVAGPGMGKSSIAAWLTQVREDVVAIHFCTQQNSRTRDPHEFVVNLVAQLHSRLPGFAEAVEAKLPNRSFKKASDAFRELIVEVLRSLPSLDRPYLIIIDSLDESLEQSGENVLEVLVQQASDLPSWMRIIATTRPEEAVIQRIRTLNVFELMSERSENKADVEQYIQYRLGASTLQQKISGEDKNAVVSQLAVLSEGNYLYARMALDALADGSMQVTDLHQLSPGLTGFFYETFTKRFPDIEIFERNYAPLLKALTAAKGPLSFRILKNIEKEEAGSVRRRLHDLRSYLRILGQGESATYAVYHRSLKDWLTNPDASGPYWCQTASGNHLLSSWGWQIYFSGQLNSDDYFSRYLPDHLVVDQEWPKLAQILSDLDLFEQAWKQGRKYQWMNYWQNIREYYEPGACYNAELNKLIQSGTEPNHIAYLSDTVGAFLRDMGLLSEALPFTKHALDVREELYGKEHPDLAISIHNLAELYRAQRNFEFALPLYQRALEIRKISFGSDSTEVATSLHDIAEFYHDQQKYDFALRYYQHALNIRKAALNPNDPTIADCLNDMAALFYEMGDNDKALPGLNSAKEIYETAYGPEHPDVAACLHNISRIYKSQGDYKNAISYCLRALNILDRTFGPNHPKTQLCTKTLLEHYKASTNFPDAIPVQIRQLAFYKQTLGSDHPEVESAILDLAENYKQIKDLENAALCYRDVVLIKNRTLAPDSIDLCTSLESLAWHFLGLRAYSDAVVCSSRAASVREKIQGLEDPATATSLNILVRCLQEKGEHATALPICRRALSIRQKSLPSNHADVGISLNNLGLTLVGLGQFEEAELHLLKAVSINPISSNPHYWLAKLYQQRAKSSDLDMEQSEWQAYLKLGPTSKAREDEAISRLQSISKLNE